MNRRFTLFALLIAVCLLFASCGALTLSNHTGTLIIPLGTPGREAATLKFGQSYCERYEFTLYNKTTTLTATGTDSVIFSGIPAGTYSLKGKAFGILVDGKEHVIATSKNEGIVIAGSEEITIGISFYLEEIAFEDTQTPEGNVTYSVNPQTSTITMTVYQENSEIKVSETENQSDGTRIVREFSSSQGNQKTKETVTEPDGKKTISEFRLNTATEGCAKRVTVEEGNTTTVEKFDSNEAVNPTEKVVTTVEPTETTIITFNQRDMTNKASEKVIESTKTTTTEFVTGSSKTAKVTEEITSGTDKGQKTVTEYNTQLSGQTPVRSTVTITYPDERTEVQTYNNNDKLTRKEETISAVSTVTLYNYDTVNKATSETLYASGYSPDQGTSVSDQSNAIRTITRTYDENDQEVKLAITDFEYDDNIIAYKADDASATEIPPYKTITTVTTSNGISTTSVTTFDYSKDSNSSGKLADKTTKVDGVETEYERFTYAADGLLDTESYKTLTETGYTTKETVWRYDSVHVIVKDRDATSTTLFDKQGGSVRCSSTVTKTFDSSGIEQDSKEEDNGVAAEAVLDFLSQNYYVGGSSLANLNFINDSSATASQYEYFYHVDFADFYKCHPGCFKYDPIKNGTLTCYLHNNKSGCTNFWDATINDSNGTSQKFSSHIKGSNLGTAEN